MDVPVTMRCTPMIGDIGPIMVLEGNVMIHRLTPVGDPVDLLISRCLALGMAVVTGLAAPFRGSLPRLPDWHVARTGDRVRLTASQLTVFEGQVGPPPGWAERIDAHGEVVVLIGTGPYPISDPVGLVRAVAAGRVVGAVVASSTQAVI